MSRRGPLRIRDLLPQLKALGDDREAIEDEDDVHPEGHGDEKEERTYPEALAVSGDSGLGRTMMHTFPSELPFQTPRSLVSFRVTPRSGRKCRTPKSSSKKSAKKGLQFSAATENTPRVKVDPSALPPRLGLNVSNKFSTPASTNLSSNSILRECRKDITACSPFDPPKPRDGITDADSARKRIRTPLFPLPIPQVADDRPSYPVRDRVRSDPVNDLPSQRPDFQNQRYDPPARPRRDSEMEVQTSADESERNAQKTNSRDRVKMDVEQKQVEFLKPPIPSGSLTAQSQRSHEHRGPVNNERPRSPQKLTRPVESKTCQTEPTENKSNKFHNSFITVKGKLYAVLGNLGCGGSSEVFKVMDPKTSALYAVKCVNMATDAATALSYMNEIQLLDKLQGSDRVITMYSYEYIKSKKKLYVVLEVGDVDLSSLLKFYRTKEQFLPYPILIGYWTEMLTAVNHIHKNGIIHSDLKPANFLMVHGRLKLIDFGIASSLNADATSIMMESTKGTFNYISPEAITLNSANSAAKISYRSDVWSLGCILYSMLYGHTPFSHVKQLYARIAVLSNPNQKIEYPPLQGVPPVLMKALQWCLTFDVKKRPTVQELIDLPYLNVGYVPRPSPLDIPLHIMAKIKSALTDQEWQQVTKAMGADTK